MIRCVGIMQRQAAQVLVHGGQQQSVGSTRAVNLTGPTILSAKMSVSSGRSPAAMTGRLPKKDPLAIYKETVRSLLNAQAAWSCIIKETNTL